MGLTGFYQLIRSRGKYAPKLLTQYDFRGKWVALDGDYALYKAMLGSTSGVPDAASIARCVAEWFTLSKQHGIHLIMVISGGPPPKEKTQEHQKRRAASSGQLGRATNMKRKVAELETAISTAFKQRKIQEDSSPQDLPEETHTTNIPALVAQKNAFAHKAQKLENNSRRITSTLSRKVVTILQEQGHLCILSASEADFLLSLLSEERLCDYVATEDSDILLSGAQNTVRNFLSTLYKPTAEVPVFNRQHVLSALGVTSDQLLELGTVLKCDYQPGITQLGAVKGWNMIREYQTVSSFLQSAEFGRSRMSLPPDTTKEEFCAQVKRTKEIFQWRPDRSQLDTYRPFLKTIFLRSACCSFLDFIARFSFSYFLV